MKTRVGGGCEGEKEFPPKYERLEHLQISAERKQGEPIFFKSYDEPATIMSVFYVLILSISKASTLDGNLYLLFADGDTRHRRPRYHP